MKPLTPKQSAYLASMIALLRKHGCPPPLTAVREHSGYNSSRGAGEARTLRGLLRGGYIKQPWRFGPYMPLKDAEGRRVVVLVSVESAAEVDQCAG